MSDRHGLKYYLVAGPLITSVFLSLIGILPEFYLVIIFLFIGNLGIAAYHPASAAIAGHFGGKRRGFSSSLINFGGNLGSASGSLIIILILEKAGIEYTPLILIPGIITSLILLKYAPKNNIISRPGKSLNISASIKKINRASLYMLFIILFIIYAIYIIWITAVNYMPLYFTDKNISLINIGNILLLFGALGGASGLLSGYLYDHFKKGRIIIQAALIISIPLFFFTFTAQGMLSIILFIAAGIFLISIQPVCIRMAQDILPGNMSLASSLILGLSPGLAGTTMIFLGKAADIIGIAALIRYELMGLVISLIILCILPVLRPRPRQ